MKKLILVFFILVTVHELRAADSIYFGVRCTDGHKMTYTYKNNVVADPLEFLNRFKVWGENKIILVIGIHAECKISDLTNLLGIVSKAGITNYRLFYYGDDSGRAKEFFMNGEVVTHKQLQNVDILTTFPASKKAGS